MSELKATTAQEIVRNEKDCDYMDELFGGVKMPPTQVYLKSEADKVIARHKYKRCLAMARYYEEEVRDSIEYMRHCGGGYDAYVNVHIEKMKKRLETWRSLADKFKEACK